MLPFRWWPKSAWKQSLRQIMESAAVSCLAREAWWQHPVCLVPYGLLCSMLLYMLFHIGLLYKLRSLVLAPCSADKAEMAAYRLTATQVYNVAWPVVSKIEGLCHDLVEEDLAGPLPHSTALNELVTVFNNIIRCRVV